MAKHYTAWGVARVTSNGLTIVGGAWSQLAEWATRSGNERPLSKLTTAQWITATFDPQGNLVDLEHPGVTDLPEDELNAWVSDVLAEAGLTDHPAIRN